MSTSPSETSRLGFFGSWPQQPPARFSIAITPKEAVMHVDVASWSPAAEPIPPPGSGPRPGFPVALWVPNAATCTAPTPSPPTGSLTKATNPPPSVVAALTRWPIDWPLGIAAVSAGGREFGAVARGAHLDAELVGVGQRDPPASDPRRSPAAWSTCRAPPARRPAARPTIRRSCRLPPLMRTVAVEHEHAAGAADDLRLVARKRRVRPGRGVVDVALTGPLAHEHVPAQVGECRDSGPACQSSARLP